MVEVRNIRDINLIPEQKQIITLKLLYSVYRSYIAFTTSSSCLPN